MRTVIVILKRQFLQVGKDILADIVNDILAGFYHQAAADPVEDHAQTVNKYQYPDQQKQLVRIRCRDRHIQRTLDDHRRQIPESTAQTA